MKKIKDIEIRYRPLSKREKILIIVLVYTIIFSLLFKLVFLPQVAKIDKLQSVKREYRSKISNYNKILKKEDSITKDLKMLNRKKDRITSDYFSTLNHSEILYILSDLMKDKEFHISDLSFSELKKETYGELDIYRLDILVPFYGTYSGISRVINSIINSSKKIIIDSLLISSKNKSILDGQMNLRIYGLGGQTKSPQVSMPTLNIVDRDSYEDPFIPYDGYEEDMSEMELENDRNISHEENTMDILEKSFQRDMKILHEFRNDGYDFIPSGPLIKGSAIFSPFSKFGGGSLRLEYDILALEDDNRAYVDLSSRNIILNRPPEYISIWVYSYGDLPGILGIRFMTQSGDCIDFEVMEGRNYDDWSYIKQKLNVDTKSYPLKLDKIFYQAPKGTEDVGIIFIDRLEAYYRDELHDIDSDSSFNNFYVVQYGDTLESISEKLYSTKEYTSELMKLNHISSPDMIYEGRILIFKRH